MHAHTFEELVTLAEARERVRNHTTTHDRTTTIGIEDAVGRVLAEPITAHRPVPHYERAAMDGYAVRAADTFGASRRTPVVLHETTTRPGPNEAVPVHTGSELPTGADAVVMIENVERHGPDLEIYDAVAEGENVAPVGEDVHDGQALYTPGHRVRPPDLGLLKATNNTTITVYEPPDIAVIPTGEELVHEDPAPGEVIETNGLTVAHYVTRWGGTPRYRDITTDDPDALHEAITRDLDADIIATTGGSSVGERDRIPEVVDELGTILAHGLAIKPGHPVGVGVIDDTPVFMLPGYPVSCIITATQLLRPTLHQTGRIPTQPFPRTNAVLETKLRSEPGIRSYVRVSLTPQTTADPPTASRIRASGAGVLSSVTAADGWVEIPEPIEGYDANQTVPVQDWEWQP